MEYDYISLERQEQGNRAIAQGFYSVAGSLGFGGLPLPGTSRIASRAEGSYMAVGPAYDTGFMPAVRRRIFTAGLPKPSSPAISAIVKPSMQSNMTDGRKKIKKNISISAILYLTKYIEYDRLYKEAIGKVAKPQEAGNVRMAEGN